MISRKSKSGYISYFFQFLCLSIFCFFGCAKSTTPDNPVTPPPIVTPVQPSQPVTVLPGTYYTLYSPGSHVKQVQYYAYNTSNQLTAIRIYGYDSSSLTNGPITDSISIGVNYSGQQTSPSSYDIIFQYHFSPTGGTREHHILQYDAQNRIVLDSISDGDNSTNQSRLLFNYIEPNIVTCKHIDLYDIYSNTVVASVDSLNIDSENISYWLNYRNVNGGSKEYDFKFSEYSNPVYNESFAKGIGLSLVVFGYGDFRSKHLPKEKLLFSVSTGIINYNNFISDLYYTWTSDSTGRVVLGAGRAGLTGPVVEYTYYTYVSK